MKGGKHTGDCLPENKNPCKKLYYDPVDLFCGCEKKKDSTLLIKLSKNAQDILNRKVQIFLKHIRRLMKMGIENKGVKAL